MAENHTSELPCLLIQTSASNFHPEVKLHPVHNWVPAKPGSSCQQRPGAGLRVTTTLPNPALWSQGAVPTDFGGMGAGGVPTSPPSLFPPLRSLSISEQQVGKVS